MQHALKLCNCLHLVDVGAVIDRPRAIDNRPYGFYRGFCAFYNAPLLLLRGQTVASFAEAFLRAFFILYSSSVASRALVTDTSVLGKQK